MVPVKAFCIKKCLKLATMRRSHGQFGQVSTRKVFADECLFCTWGHQGTGTTSVVRTLLDMRPSTGAPAMDNGKAYG